MKVKVILKEGFNDVEGNTFRKYEEVFECTKERYEYLSGGNTEGIVAVEEVKEKVKEVKKEEEKPIKTTKRKLASKK